MMAIGGHTTVAVGPARLSAGGLATVESALGFAATGCGGEQKSAMTGMSIRSMDAVRLAMWNRGTFVGVRGRIGSAGAPGINALRDAAQGQGPRNLQRSVTTAIASMAMGAAVHAELNADGRAPGEIRVLLTVVSSLLLVVMASEPVLRSVMTGTRSMETGAHRLAA